jgi:hypothetical protein
LAQSLNEKNPSSENLEQTKIIKSKEEMDNQLSQSFNEQNLNESDVDQKELKADHDDKSQNNLSGKEKTQHTGDSVDELNVDIYLKVIIF